MQDSVPLLQPSACLTERRLLENADFIGVEYHSMFMCKSKRGVKRDDSKETYKLPHRLIEKKRRDRINECISQLKDLLPEHLKLTTLGHLEKAVVLELTLKHLKALTTLTEQQHQRIIALQNGDTTLKAAKRSDLDAFHSGFQTCAQEVLQHLTRFESWTPREQVSAQLISHLHRAATQPRSDGEALGAGQAAAGGAERGRARENCVPVIRRTAEHSSSDTDTDSGYGGEGERSEGKGERLSGLQGATGTGRRSLPVKVKLEPEDPPAKRVRVGTSEAGCDLALLSAGIGAMPTPGQQPPFCLPLYFIAPSAATPYLPVLGGGDPERRWYPAPIPFFYPGLHGIAALAAEAQLCRVPSPAAGAGGDLSPAPDLLRSPGGVS
ncbi:class E basic helix-loop-helix protein 41 [Pristis pectinata]|uniref:class E basic helix-loop-helix protein 41 n=1 Tax=Pristis pectinata TaxID=685728 RepID=UPI00223DCE85|nr:class E basic helix-loop-helix protein 41 [Pristis pectinata]